MTIAALVLASLLQDDEVSLAQYLAKSGLQNVVAIGASSLVVESPKSLRDFKRMLVQVGSLHVIVPTSMKVFADNPPPRGTDPRDLPENLRRAMFYTSLSDAQWKLLCGPGISAQDCSDEQRPLLLAQFPKPFAYYEYEVKRDPERGVMHEGGDKVTLSDAELRRVRFRMERSYVLHGEGVAFIAASSHLLGEKYLQQSSIFGEDFEDEPLQPGVSVVQTRQKPSQLAYDLPALQVPITLKKLEPLGPLVRRIGSKVGLNVQIDQLAEKIKLTTNAASEKAGTILRAVALATTGTFRKVGSTYVLTSDIAGRGQLSAHYSLVEMARSWADNQRVIELSKGYGDKLAAFPIFDPKEPNAPSGALLEALSGKYNYVEMATKDLPARVRAILAQSREDKRSDRPSNLPEMVRVESTLVPVYLLPDGRKIQAEGFGDGAFSVFRAINNPSRSLGLRPQDGLALALSADLPPARALELARGAKTLWVEGAADLVAELAKLGQAKGTQVWWIAKPWDQSDGDPAHADVNIFGETSLTVGPRAKQFPQIWGNRIQALKAMAPPFAPNITPPPGVAGVVLTGGPPSGWTRNASGDFGPTGSIHQGGFLLTERERFIQEHSVDPIDLTDSAGLFFDSMTSFESILRQPTEMDDFEDEPPGRAHRLGVIWQTRLESLYRTALDRIAGGLGVPCLVQFEQHTPWQGFTESHFFSPYSKGMGLRPKPDYSDLYGIGLYGLPSDPNVAIFAPAEARTVIYDLRRVPPSQVAGVLNLRFGTPEKRMVSPMH